MKIELIKLEIEKLSALLSSWEEGVAVSAIERDLALEKLSKLYDMVKFGEQAVTPDTTIPPTALPAIEEDDKSEEQDEENEVEVELIFAEDDEEEQIEETIEEEIVAIQEEPLVKPEPITITEPAPKSAVKPEPAPVSAPAVETKPIVESEQGSVTEREPMAEQPTEKHTRKPSMESLFGAEEIQRKPRSKHQRMMAIYSEPQQKAEKVVDISKIFDLDEEDDNFEISVSSNTPISEPIAQSTVNDISSNDNTILADTIVHPTTTLADTITSKTALAEEITHAHTKSLRKAIGINDKFLMTRDLFDGDDKAFEKAIAELDECETLDDCMIYIVENYEWNPDSEGAKFIMQLLERKHS